MTLLPALLFKVYALNSRMLRKTIRVLLTRLEGGEMLSSTLRRIFSEYHKIEIGLYSYGSCFDLECIGAHTKIGRYCSFASGVCILNRNHPVEFKSTHPYFFNTQLGYVKKEFIPMRNIVIGNDVWVGQNVLILPSVGRIGDGAVIGAGTVVTKDVPDFAIAVGNPGKVVKYRFSDQTIRKLKEERWWDKDINELQRYFNDFTHAQEELGDKGDKEKSKLGDIKADGLQ
jgi:virginiamycin A acetyltransferase